MPLSMGPNLPPDDIFIVGLDDNDVPGDTLGAGQTCTLTSADPATWVVTQDAVPRVTTKLVTLADGTAVPVGTATLASGTIAPAAKPAQPNVAINITSHLANADGSPILDDTNAPIPDDVDTATFVPNQLKKMGMLFVSPV